MPVSVSEQKSSLINTPEHKAEERTILSPIKTQSKTGSNFQPLTLNVVKENKTKENKKLKDKIEKPQTSLSNPKDCFNLGHR